MSSVLDEIAPEGFLEIDPFVISAALKAEPEMPIVLALDIGTSGARAMLLDGRGEEIETAQIHFTGELYQALSSGGDADADLLVNFVADAIDRLLERSAAVPRINFVAISCFWHSLLGVNAEGLAVTPVFSWADTRAAETAKELRTRFDERRFHQRTGCRFHSSYWPAKLLWLRAERSRLYQATTSWMSFAEYLQLRLLGETEASVSMASGTGLFNQHTCQWDDELLRNLELSSKQLPRIAQPGGTFTELTTEYTIRWPALNSAQWFPAIGDGAANNIGAGCATADSILLMIGTSSAMRIVYEGDPPSELPPALWSYRVDRGRVVVGGALSDGGGLYRWMRETLALPECEDDIEGALAAMGPDAHGLTILPFWAGERSPGWSASARGSIMGLTSSTQAIDILRAAMESIAYQLVLLTEALDSLSPQTAIVAAGNALRASPCWTQIIADVLGRTIRLSTAHEASCRGAALLALEAVGKIDNLARISADVDRVFIPDMGRHELYRAGRERQQRAYDKLMG